MAENPRRIGPYALQSPLARTPAATLWSANRADGKSRGPQRVAIRLLAPNTQRRHQDRLAREYRRLSAMGDAQVPAVVAHYSGTGALVMDFLDGVLLSHLLQARAQGILSINRGSSLEIALSLARTLRVAQSKPDPIVHARLTPAEVLITTTGRVVLLGWGAWSPVDWGLDQPPELAQGQGREEGRLSRWPCGLHRRSPRRFP